MKSAQPADDDNVRKTKRNRRSTECSVIRRKDGCGICGSRNIAEQGVRFCQICGEEVEYLIDAREWWWRTEKDAVNCACLETHVGRKGRVFKSRKLGRIGAYKCLDCGAVGRRSFCPNNSGSHRSWSLTSTCWKHWKGGVFCQCCGYRK